MEKEIRPRKKRDEKEMLVRLERLVRLRDGEIFMK
jgi:hypothetical protein